MLQLPTAPAPAPDMGKPIGPFDQPIPGESLTVAPGKYPYERPPQYANVEDALFHVFQRLIQPRTAAQLLTFIEAGLPVTLLVEMIVTGGAQEGLWTIPMSMVMVPAITVMILRMAQAAKLVPVMSSDELRPERADAMMLRMAEARVSGGQVERAQKAGTASTKELATEGGKARLLDVKGFV